MPRAKQRAKVAGDIPRLLVMDWLKPQRDGWSEADVKAYAETCARVAAAFQPDHFEVATDVNAYLCNGNGKAWNRPFAGPLHYEIALV